MTVPSETTAFQRLASVDWQVDGGYLYSRELTAPAARQIRVDLGEYAVVAVGHQNPIDQQNEAVAFGMTDTRKVDPSVRSD